VKSQIRRSQLDTVKNQRMERRETAAAKDDGEFCEIFEFWDEGVRVANRVINESEW